MINSQPVPFRIIANLSINEEIGAAIASDEILMGLLVNVLESKCLSMDADPPDELLLNTMATINNLSYYMVEDEDVSSEGRAVYDMGSMLRLACSLRPLTYRFEAKSLANNTRHLPVNPYLISLLTVLLPAIIFSTNEECVLEASRVFGNLSQIQQVRHFMVDNTMDKLFITLLDSANRELVFTSGERCSNN